MAHYRGAEEVKNAGKAIEKELDRTWVDIQTIDEYAHTGESHVCWDL